MHIKLLAQLDQCKGVPQYMMRMGFNPQQSFLSSSEKFIMGLVLLQTEQSGNPNSRVVKRIQKESWKNKGYLGAISTDEKGNSYVLPTANVNMLYNKPEFQNSIYKLDSETGELELFINLPTSILPGAKNPFGLLGSFYDCSSRNLIVSSVAGSDEKNEIGKVYAVDVIRKTYKILIEDKDIYGLAIQNIQGKKYLFLSSARTGDLFSIELDQQLNPKGKLKRELSIQGLGPRGDDRIRKIRFNSNGQMQLFTAMFYFNLTAPSEVQKGTMLYQWNSVKKQWFLVKEE